MLSSTFATFDLSLTTDPNPLMYMTGFAPLLMFHQFFWTTLPHRTMVPMNWILHMNIHHMNKSSTYKIKGLKAALSLTFISILLLNFWAMTPYSTTLSTHLLLTLSWSSPLWVSLILLAVPQIRHTATHLMPKSGPWILAPFLVSIEFLSMIIRPITLAFRLAANMTAGHVILSLLTTATTFTIFYLMFTLSMMPMLSSYVMFELMICFIQAFVFFILMTMYTNDHF